MYFRTGNPKGLTESGSGELGIIVCGRVPWLYQYWPGGFMLLLVLCPGTPGGSTGNGSGFKASQKMGQRLEVSSSSDRLGELGIVFVSVFLGCTSTGRVGLGFLWFYVQELPKAQPAEALVLKRLLRRGHGIKSHPTDWEKPGIKPATPGLQDIGLSPRN